VPRYLTAEADLDFPVPNAERVAAQLRVMQRRGATATTQAVANEFGVTAEAILAVLRRAERAGMVAFAPGQGWTSLQT
jgi:Mn-dependent DtxR family transcriptional regulator